MKNISTILSIVALAGVAGLFVMHFNNGQSSAKSAGTNAQTDSHTHGQIGYFEMDSVEQHYNYIKAVREQLKKDEDNISAELGGLKKNYMGRIQQLQAKAPTMSQQEGEAAQAEINQMQMTLQQREAQLTQNLQEKQFKKMKEINDKIAEFLKTYNGNKKFAYIISRSPGDFVYFADSAYNITDDVIKGLNATYTPQK